MFIFGQRSFVKILDTAGAVLFPGPTNSIKGTENFKKDDGKISKTNQSSSPDSIKSAEQSNVAEIK